MSNIFDKSELINCLSSIINNPDWSSKCIKLPVSTSLANNSSDFYIYSKTETIITSLESAICDNANIVPGIYFLLPIPAIDFVKI